MLLSAEQLSINFGSRQLLQDVDFYLNEGDKTGVIGINGTGKSTLLEAIAVAVGFNPEGGTRNFNFSTRNTHSDLCDCISLTRYGYPKDGFFLRAESFYNVASNIDELDEAGGIGPQLKDSYGGRSLHAQSHGESFISLVQNLSLIHI